MIRQNPSHEVLTRVVSLSRTRLWTFFLPSLVNLAKSFWPEFMFSIRPASLRPFRERVMAYKEFLGPLEVIILPVSSGTEIAVFSPKIFNIFLEYSGFLDMSIAYHIYYFIQVFRGREITAKSTKL